MSVKSLSTRGSGHIETKALEVVAARYCGRGKPGTQRRSAASLDATRAPPHSRAVSGVHGQYHRLPALVCFCADIFQGERIPFPRTMRS